MSNWIKNILYGYYYFRAIYKISPKYGANMIFRRFFHRDINWDNPQNLQEKTYWLLFNTNTDLWTLCADKYRVREYVKEKGAEEILTNLYGQWENVEDIDFNTLPNEFVLKANNGCGSIIVVKDKSKVDFNHVKKTLKQWMKYPFGYNGSQFHYLRIKPCIVAEQLLEEQGETKNLSPHSMVDYKIWCFNGEPECVLVVFDRAPGFTQQAVYDLEWNDLSPKVFKADYYKKSFPKPKNLDKMLDYARKLSKGFSEVRADFYNIDGIIYFGELTFTAGYGDLTDEYYTYLGSRFKLPIEK